MSRLILSLLAFYKRFISPLLGARCRFHPSCSDYARVAVARFGSTRGSWLAINRLLRCQPMCDGGFDPVPAEFSWRPFLREKIHSGHDHE
ncbi:MAG: membrane protein insertion efficiency factor YidD [Xanthomonadales bacterium]|nr:membrane protein insertion efficiency factor YidD [Xanthomonadales bacterium]